MMKREKPLIKIRPSELKEKSIKELLKMKKQMEIHILKAHLRVRGGRKGFNIKEEKKNIARVNTIIVNFSP